ncbi:MAG: uroporphyrinogen decarboxylase family protein [Anaerolineae bacterium]
MSQKSPEELYAERVKRVLDVAALRVPDRVPVFGPYQLYPYTFAGVTFKDAMNDYALAREACHKFQDYFQPDLDFGPVLAYPAPAMEMLDIKWFRWAGHGLGDHIMYQYIESENMTADEYDEFLYDPSHFIMSKWLPRSFPPLAGLAGWPALRTFMWFGWTGGFVGLTSPEVQEALRNAAAAGEELGRWFASLGQYYTEAKEKGVPSLYAALDWPPFDIIGDTLRGTREILADMRRRPDKLHDALEVATKIFIEYGSGAAGADLPLCWIWMHKGTRNFMSDAQFKEFYWPYLRKGMLALIEKGIIPVVYCEADVESRLEHFADVPPGKVIYHVSTTDMVKAKSVLGGIAAIAGNVPNVLLLSGTPDDIRAYCKNLIDTVGKGGGFIMDTAVMLDEARPENLKAMIDFTKEYGVYS